MKLTTLIKLDMNKEQQEEVLLKLVRFNSTCNYLSRIAFSEKVYHWNPLQKRAYYEIREKFGLLSSETQILIRKVAYAYKNKENRKTLVKFKSLGSIPLSRHIYRNGNVKFYGIEVPIISKIELQRKPKQATLVYRNGKLLIHQSHEVQEPLKYEPKGWLGCDFGIKNILTDSYGKIYSGGKLNNIRKRHNKIRTRLQLKGTRSARRLLNKRRTKESRFSRDINNQISKNVVIKAKSATFGIAIEDLKGISSNTRVRKADRSKHSSWGFRQLRFFIDYKAKLNGIPLLLVDPRNTSRTCPICGKVDKKNRKTQAWFKCIECGYGHHADTVAAINISRRAASNQPYAPLQNDVRIQSLMVRV